MCLLRQTCKAFGLLGKGILSFCFDDFIFFEQYSFNGNWINGKQIRKTGIVMNSSFSIEEKRKFMLKKHIQNHLFEYIFDFIGRILITVFILYLCKAEKIIYGIILSAAYSLGKLIYDLYHYKKEYIDMDIK